MISPKGGFRGSKGAMPPRYQTLCNMTKFQVLYFKMLQLLRDGVPRPLCRGFGPGPHC